ncbi:hypothetical protein Aduo_006831 [Ancylostoma duodenale]
MRFLGIALLIGFIIGATAIVENGNAGLPNGKTFINPEGLFEINKPFKLLTATCPANKATTVMEKTSSSTSVETISSEDKRCTTTVKKFSTDNSRNSTTVVTTGNRVITITSYTRTLIVETTSTSVADVEPTSDTPTVETVATTKEFPSEPTSTTLTTSFTSTRAPTKGGIFCIFVADAYNFGNDGTRYAKYLIGNMSDYFFKSTVGSKAGITKYGYVSTFSVHVALNELKDSHEEFTKVIDTAPDEDIAEPFDTAEAIEIVNRFTKLNGHANALIFISAQKDTKNLPKLEPRSKDWKRIIAVGFDGTDLNNVVDKKKGVAVSVPYNFSMADVKNVIDALLEVF